MLYGINFIEIEFVYMFKVWITEQNVTIINFFNSFFSNL